jgi:hypothetical protein
MLKGLNSRLFAALLLAHLGGAAGIWKDSIYIGLHFNNVHNKHIL